MGNRVVAYRYFVMVMMILIFHTQVKALDFITFTLTNLPNSTTIKEIKIRQDQKFAISKKLTFFVLTS